MKHLYLFAWICLMSASAIAEDRTVMVDASLIVGKVAEELGADSVGLPELVMLDLNDAAAACGVTPEALRASCTALSATPALIEALGNALAK